MAMNQEETETPGMSDNNKYPSERRRVGDADAGPNFNTVENKLWCNVNWSETNIATPLITHNHPG